MKNQSVAVIPQQAFHLNFRRNKFGSSSDDHPVAREGLASILKSFEGMQVVGEAADGKEACELADL